MQYENSVGEETAKIQVVLGCVRQAQQGLSDASTSPIMSLYGIHRRGRILRQLGQRTHRRGLDGHGIRHLVLGLLISAPLAASLPLGTLNSASGILLCVRPRANVILGWLRTSGTPEIVCTIVWGAQGGTHLHSSPMQVNMHRAICSRCSQHWAEAVRALIRIPILPFLQRPLLHLRIV